jgi:hypothetical protein
MTIRKRLFSRRRRVLPICVCALTAYAIGSIWYWNQQAILQQKEAPLDHIQAALQKPLYALSCPVIPNHDTDKVVKDRIARASTIPAVMISARSPEKVQPVYDSWKHAMHITLVSTLNISRAYRNTRCQTHTWASQLFAVYQDVFTRLLDQYPDAQHFVTVEDDTVLLNATRLYQELDWAVAHNVGYYSFTSTSTSTTTPASCIYQYYTTAQLISRRLMRQVATADNDSFCRLPIDMFIARAGPWYVTTKPVTKHIGKRLKIQKKK